MKTSYTYTVLRYVHDITTGEFLNIGVFLYASEAKFANGLFRTTYARLSSAFPGVNGDAFRALMRFIQARCETYSEQFKAELPLSEAPKSALDIAVSILPRDDSSLQWSEIGSGIAEDPSQVLESIFRRFVTRYDDRSVAQGRSDDDVWKKFKKTLEERNLTRVLRPKKITVQDDEVEFEHAWQNGIWHCLEPVSLDLTAADSIREKAHRWLGQLTSVKESSERFKVYMLVGEPRREGLEKAFEKAVSILRKTPVQNEIVLERDAEEFSERFAKEVVS